MKRPTNTIAYQAWRKEVLKRDKHRCQMPGCKRRTRLQAHHIVPWASSHYIRYAVSNGVTLCKQHHKQITGNELHYISLFMQIVANNANNTRH